MLLRAVLAVLLSVPLFAQVVRVANHSVTTFSGWKRTVVDIEPTHPVGEVGSALYVVGNKLGLDTWAVDLRMTLAPGERRTVDLSTAAPSSFTLGPPKGRQWTGGPITVNGLTMRWVGAKADGAAWVAHLRRRTGRMMSTDVWLRSYPGQPWAEGELLHTCSNPAVPDMGEDAAALRVQFGTGVVVGAGRQFWQPLVDASTFADGQARALPFTVLWLTHIKSREQVQSWQSVESMSIGAVGISKLLTNGNPVLPAGTRAVSWARQYLPAAIAATHDWRAPVASIAAGSPQTGSQYDQIFRHGEPTLPDGAGAEWVSYLCAMKYSNRPCHHLELGGARLIPAAHSNAVFWQSRPHWHPSIGPDKLGKPGPLDPWNIPGGFFGADREHWLIGTLCAGSRYTGSPALQQLLEHQAVAFLLGETVKPGLSTSHTDAARSVGYAGLVAVQLWTNLQDRTLAAQIRDRWRERVTEIYIPEISLRQGDVWDPRPDDRIIGDLDWLDRTKGIRRTPRHYTHGTMWWQQSLGSWGLDYGCSILGPQEGRAIALRGALATLRHAWRKHNGQWLFFDNIGYANGEVLPESEYVEGLGVHRTGWFDNSWAVPGIATILQHDPTHEQALEIWEQVASNGGSWVPPGVR